MHTGCNTHRQRQVANGRGLHSAVWLQCEPGSIGAIRRRFRPPLPPFPPPTSRFTQKIKYSQLSVLMCCRTVLLVVLLLLVLLLLLVVVWWSFARLWLFFLCS